MITVFRNCLALLIFASSAAVGQPAGQAALPDYRLEPAAPHGVTLGYGLSSALELTLANQGSSPADWKLVFENAGPTGLAGVLEGLDENSARVLSVIPDRYLFSEGITGSSIGDGGNDMYDGGNMLQAGTAALSYSNGVVANTAAGAGSVSYFTRKLDGLFVFAADFTGVNSFAITGNLGADGSGLVSADEFTVESGGVSYRAFIHRVYSAGDPSINQLILVPQKTGLSRTYLSTTSDENHRVSGLGASSRVYYLLFAKPAGGFYATDVFQNLAAAFLGSVESGPGWAFGDPPLGRVEASQSGPVRIGVSAAGLEPGNHSARFAVVPQALAYAAIPAGAFRDLTLTVTAPAFTVPGGNVAVSTLSGLSPEPVDVNLQPSVNGAVLNGLQVSSSQPWLIPSVAAGTNAVRLAFNASGLAAGTYRATVEVWNGGTRQIFEVSLVTSALNVVKFLPDPARPRIYAVNGNGLEQGSLLVIDALTHTILRNIPLGRKPTDCDIGDGGTTLFAINSVDQTISAIDLATLAVTATHTLPAYTNWDPAETHAHVRAGKGNILYYVDGQWGPRLRVFNRATGQVLQTFGANSVGTDNDDGIGGLVIAPDGSSIFTWEQYGWSAGVLGTYISKFRVNTDGTLAFESKTTSARSANFDRDPLDTPAMITADGSRLIVKDRAFLTSDLAEVPVVYPDEIYSITRGGEIAAGASAIYSGQGGEILHTLPVAAPVQAITPDYSAMVYFNPTTRAIIWLDLIATLGTEALGLQIEPADGATVARPDRLQWFPVTGILRYQVYLGTNRGGVEAATPSSASYLGETANTWFDLSTPLAVGQSYFWRVVPISAGGQPASGGVTRSFFVSNLTLSRSSIAAETVEGVIRHVETITLQAASPQAWSATADVPWIGFESGSGSTPGNLVAVFDATSLTPGYHVANITLTSGGISFAIPVSFRVLNLNVTKLVAHPTRPVVYGINAAAAGEGVSRLLEIDSSTARILRALPIGSGPTDADLDAASERLYVTNWGYPKTRVVDVAGWSELPFLSFGDDVYNLEVTPRGRMITEGRNQRTLKLWNIATGVELNSVWSYNGDGVADPSGDFYYQYDYSSSAIRKYDISSDTLGNVLTSLQFNGGAGIPVLSGDGSKLFFQSRVIDANLNPIAQLPAEVHATDRSGALGFGTSQVWWSDSGTAVATLPFASMIAAVSSNDSHLVRFNATTGTLHSTPLANFTDLPGPFPRPGQVVDVSPARLSWSPVAGATSYRVFIAPDAAALSAMTVPVATVATAFYDLPSPLAFGKFYSWRVDAVTGSGVTTGAVRSFGINFPDGPPLAMFGNGSAGISASISDRHLLVGVEGSAQLYQFDPATGANSPAQSFTLPGYYGDHQFGGAVAVDAGKASVGAYALDNPADSGGSAFVYRPGNSGYWESSGPLSPPSPVANELFGRGLAASGNQMLVGTGNTYNTTGRVAAYITEPAASRVQTFGANDGQAGDGFGRVIAMEGNQAVISAPGWGASYNRVPALYAFSRSTTTGLWTQTQKIAISGASTFDSSGTALALSGNYLATNNGSSDTVVIYTKNGSGQWSQSATISQTGVAGSSSFSFGNALALSGDQLFIGDPGATHAGTSGGAVFSFRRSGAAWIAGPVIAPGGTRSNFGGALAVRDGWLLATGGSSQPAWLFRIDAPANQTPRFEGDIPSQVVAGRAFSTEIRADDADGNAGLVIDLLQRPAWLGLVDQSNGRATLSGTPSGNSGDVHTVQIRVRDAAGGQALHTYQLTLLAPADLPRLTLEPVGGDAGEGQELILRAAVSGIGPFKWQWYRDGEAIAGANRATLAFGEITLGDSGAYGVRVSNVVGEVASTIARIDVHPANRFAGDWPTFGGSARHTGYHPARLGRHTFVPAWSRQIHPTNALNRVAVADGRVFVSASSRFEAAPSIRALDLPNGSELWSASIPSSNSINPPTWHDGTVYFQRGKGIYEEVGPQLIALDASTGARRWASVFGAQWENYEAPAVTDDGIWINGGAYGGMYGFNLSGSQRFFRTLAQVDGWTPTISGAGVFSWVGGIFQEHNPSDGTTLWSVTVNTAYYGNTGVAAVAAGSAVVVSASDIVCIDLPSRSIRWRQAGNFTGTPAISNGRTHAIQGGTVVSFSLADGTPGPAVTVPATIVSGQPLLVMEHLFVASASHTYVVDLATSAVVRTLAGGGLLSYSNGHLLAAGNDGTLRSWFANGAPEFTADLPVSINAGDAAADFQINLTDHVVDTDPGETLSWEIVSVTDPALFRGLQIGASSGVLSVIYNPWLQGSSSVTIAVTDSLGQRTEATLAFTLPVLPAPLVTAEPVIRFSRLTGLYEQKVTVTNVAQREIAGFDLSVTGLRTGVSLYNGSSTGNGSGQIAHHQPMAAGASVALVLEYYASPRGEIPLPLITAGVAGPAANVVLAAGGGPAFSVNRCVPQADGSVVIEFTAEPGRSYRVQYSKDAVHWKSCPVSIKAGGTKVQWIDRGPPWTDAAPSSTPSRFYRVQSL